MWFIPFYNDTLIYKRDGEIQYINVPFNRRILNGIFVHINIFIKSHLIHQLYFLQ